MVKHHILLAFAELQFSEREQSERGLVTQEEYSRFVATWRLEGFFGYENFRLLFCLTKDFRLTVIKHKHITNITFDTLC